MNYKQSALIKLLLTDTSFLGEMRGYLEPRFFESEMLESIVNFTYSYFDQYAQAPGTDIMLLMEKHLAKMDVDIMADYEDYLAKVMAVEVQSNGYIRDYVAGFARSARVKALIVDCYELVDRQKLDEAETLINEFFRNMPGLDIGDYAYLESDECRFANLADDSEDILFKFGINALDMIIKPLRRRQLLCILGPTKSSKSWGMQYLGLRGLTRGLKVLHISHENDVYEIERRYDQMLTKCLDHREAADVNYILRNNVGDAVGIHKVFTESVYNSEVCLKARSVIRKLGGQLRIKKYPMGSASMQDVLRLLDSLENKDGFVPDVLIEDYPDIMHKPGKDDERNKMNKLYIEHKQLADERNMLVIVGSQTNRSGFEKKYLEKSDVAEDYRKLANCDLAIGFGRDAEDAKFGVLNMTVIANRSGRDSMSCSVQQNLATGYFSTASWLEPSTASVCYGDISDYV